MSGQGGQPSATGSMPPGAWYALTLVGLCNMFSLLDRNILSILAPRIKADLHIGDGELGLLYGTMFALFYALFSLPLGRLADGWLRNRILSIAIGFWSVAAGLSAFASGFGLLAASRLGVGIGEGATAPAGTSILYDYVPKHRRGLAMAVLAAALAVGLGGSSILGGVAADWWDRRYAGLGAPGGFAGWQFAFLLAAVPGIILALFLWRLREPERGVLDGIATAPDPAPFRASGALLASVTPGPNFLVLAARRAPAGAWGANIAFIAFVAVLMTALIKIASSLSPRPLLNLGGLHVDPHVMQWTVIGFGMVVIFNLLQRLAISDKPVFAVMMRSPSVLIILGVGSLQTIVNYGVQAFTPTFLMTHYHETTAATGLKFGLLSAAIGIAGPMISGPLSDRLTRTMPGVGRIYVVLFALGLSPFAGIWTYSAPDSASFYMRFTLYSLILTSWIPPAYATLYDLVLPRMRGILSSTYLIVTTIFGVGIGPYAVGMVSDANGHDLAGAILSVNYVAPFIVLLLIALAIRVRKDQALMIPRARAAGEAIA